MSFYDLMRAICPFSYSTKDIEELKVFFAELEILRKTSTRDNHEAIRSRRIKDT
jgi:hypothetical protein